jgi:hypothetical protein
MFQPIVNIPRLGGRVKPRHHHENVIEMLLHGVERRSDSKPDKKAKGHKASDYRNSLTHLNGKLYVILSHIASLLFRFDG